jgi:hypothetical protein
MGGLKNKTGSVQQKKQSTEWRSSIQNERKSTGLIFIIYK